MMIKGEGKLAVITSEEILYIIKENGLEKASKKIVIIKGVNPWPLPGRLTHPPFLHPPVSLA